MRDEHETELIVDLWAARLPRIARFAEHCWLVVRRRERVDRWEVWQTPDRGGQSWGHLHLNLYPPRVGIRGNDAYHLRCWEGDSATQLAERIEASPVAYPWCHAYRYVPGPNSNTYVQWCLQNQYTLSWRSIGKGYAGRVT